MTGYGGGEVTKLMIIELLQNWKKRGEWGKEKEGKSRENREGLFFRKLALVN